MKQLAGDAMAPSLTQILCGGPGGAHQTIDQAFSAAYGDLCRLAGSVLSCLHAQRGLPATELVHESYLKMARGAAIRYESRGHFFAITARVMRQVVLDGMRRRRSTKRGSGEVPVALNEAIAVAPCMTVQQLELQQALQALHAFDPRKAAVIEMAGIAGMTNEEIAVALDISMPTVGRDLRVARAWLASYLESGSDR